MAFTCNCGVKLPHFQIILNSFITSNLIIAMIIGLVLTSTSKSPSSANNTIISKDKQQNTGSVIIRRIGSGHNLSTLEASSGKQEMGKSASLNSGPGPWSLQFDPSYFATLNAENHPSVDTMLSSSSDAKVSSASSQYYYSPENYGKTSHKNHQTGSFTYHIPGSTTTTSTTPTPSSPNNHYTEYSSGTSNEYSEPAPQLYSTPYNPSVGKKKKHPTTTYNYQDAEEEDPQYFDGEEEAGSRYYYPVRNRNKFDHHTYYGSDLTSMPSSNENPKSQSPVNVPAVEYGTNEETDYEANDSGGYADLKYGSVGDVKFPSKYYSGGTGAYYPSYYPSPYYPPTHSHYSSGGGESQSPSKSSSWLGPGIAGLLLGILPFGMLMASMLPAFVGLPVMSTAAVGRKRRQTQIPDLELINNETITFLDPIFNVVSKYGMTSLDEPNCLQEMFCTLTAAGKDTNSNIIQKLLYKLAIWTPAQWAHNLRMGPLFNAVKKDKCEATFECTPRKVKSSGKQKYNAA